MSLRRKERPLTLEEIKEKILETTGEAWLHSDPLCGYTNLIDHGKIIPVESKFENSVMTIFFLDPADYATDRIMENLNKWFDQYKKLPWTPIFAIRSKYLFLKSPRFFDMYRHFPFFQAMPVFIDEQNTWFDLVQATGPTLAFFQNGNLLFKTALNPNFADQFALAESKLQESLRTNDPGLPLLDVGKTTNALPIDHHSTLANELTHEGYWTAAANGIATDDPNAKITIPFTGNYLRIIASSHPQARENTKAQIFFNDAPLPANLRGHQVHAGDKGHTILEINKYTGIYEIIRTDTNLKGTITVKFLNTLENPVIIYELRSA